MKGIKQFEDFVSKVAETQGKITDYVEYVAEQVGKGLQYSEYVAEQINRNTSGGKIIRQPGKSTIIGAKHNTVSTGVHNVAIGFMSGYAAGHNAVTEEELKNYSKSLKTQMKNMCVSGLTTLESVAYDDLSDIPDFTDKLIDNDNLSDEIKISEI